MNLEIALNSQHKVLSLFTHLIVQTKLQQFGRAAGHVLHAGNAVVVEHSVKSKMMNRSDVRMCDRLGDFHFFPHPLTAS